MESGRAPYKRAMARPKQYAERTVVAFAEGTFDAIARTLAPEEDRTDFIREAVTLGLVIRAGDFYEDLRRYLLSEETLPDFCAGAIRRAVQERKTALAQIGVEPTGRPGRVKKSRVGKPLSQRPTRPRRGK